jgi:hypothetical protein
LLEGSTVGSDKA